MYLKRLEMQGFKSFPQKIVMGFGRGITAIVGPNGSGKSNIADAIRFVLGETSAKAVRGAKMDDVIFAGTQRRRSLGYAEVSLVIDNVSGRLPIEYTELRLTRRLTRIGDSEYEINGTPCRLKDIHAILMDTGLGREGYSIVGQGRIDELLSSSAQQRREVFEEATGIVRFKSRKLEAHTKLARERENLTRLHDIMEEISQKIPALEDAASKAHEYLGLREELKLVITSLFLIDQGELSKTLAQLEDNLALANEAHAKISGDMAETEEKLTAAKASQEEQEASAKAATHALAEARSAIEAHEYNVRLLVEQVAQADENLRRLSGEITAKEHILTQNSETMHTQAVTLDGLSKDRDGALSRLAELEGENEVYEEDLSKKEVLYDQRLAHRLEVVRLAGELAGGISNTQLLEGQLRQRREALLTQLEEQGEEQEVLRERTQAADTAHTLAADEESKASAEISRLEELVRNEGTSLAAMRDERTGLEKHHGELVSRRRVLQELESGYEGYQRPVRTLMQAKKRGEPLLEGVVGAVGGLVRTKAAYEHAIEVSLGGAIHNIVTLDDAAAKRAIEFLKKAGAGRATFLPLGSVRSGGGIPAAALRAQGSMGAASSLVQYESRYEAVVQSLLGRTLVVDNIDNALKISRSGVGQSVRIVTLDGELFSVGGAIAGGSRNERAASFLGRAREISELGQRIETLDAQITDVGRGLKKASEYYVELEAQLAHAREYHHKAAVLHQEAKDEASRLYHALQEGIKRNEALEAELSSLEASLEETIDHYNGQLQKQRDLLHSTALLEQELEGMQQQLADARSLREARQKGLVDTKVLLGGLEAQLEAAEAELLRIGSEQQATQEALEAIRLSKMQADNQRAAKQESLDDLAGKRQGLLNERDALGDKLANLEEGGQALRRSVAQLAAAASTHAQAHTDAKTELVRLNMRHEQASEQLRQLFDTMWYDYNLTLQSAKAAVPAIQASPEELRRRQRALKAKLSDMGDVNIGAIEEHTQARTRLNTMTEQRDDILEAEANLLELVAELDELMKTQFSEEFSRINQNFAKVFAKMFNGGTARLSLSGEDPLEAGIDINAQPPGKALQSIALLSGGERALTAAALLFAIIELRPSPFVVLDEVEAALDDANVSRLAAYLQGIPSAQFIVITHRKGTMAAADTLYGVTMEEHGVSKLVSVELQSLA